MDGQKLTVKRRSNDNNNIKNILLLNSIKNKNNNSNSKIKEKLKNVIENEPETYPDLKNINYDINVIKSEENKNFNNDRFPTVENINSNESNPSYNNNNIHKKEIDQNLLFSEINLKNKKEIEIKTPKFIDKITTKIIDDNLNTNKENEIPIIHENNTSEEENDINFDFSINFDMNEEKEVENHLNDSKSNIKNNNNVLDNFFNVNTIKQIKDKNKKIENNEKSEKNSKIIKNENIILNNNFKEVLVYKYQELCLIPMQLIEEDNNLNLNSNKIKLKYFDEELIIDKENIFYKNSSIKCLDGIENLTNLYELNELTIFKNIMNRIEKERFCTINDIFMFFDVNEVETTHNIYDDENKTKNSVHNPNYFFTQNFKNAKFDFCEWFDLNLYTGKESKINICGDNLIFIKNNIFQTGNAFNDHNNNNNNLFQIQILREILKYKNFKFYNKNNLMISKLFDFIQYLNLDSFFIFTFSENIPNFANFQFFNIFSKYTLKNKILNEKMIFNKNLDDVNYKIQIEKILSIVDINNIFPFKYKKFFIEICQKMLLNENKIYFNLLNKILEILTDLNLSKFFKLIFILILQYFIFTHFKEILPKIKTFYKYTFDEILNIIDFNKNNGENLTVYSNLILIFVFKFVLDLISFKLKENLNNSENLKLFNIAIQILNIKRNNEDFINLKIFNDTLFNKISNNNSNNNFEDKNNKNLHKFFETNFNELVSNLIKSLNENSHDLNLIIYFEKLFDLKYFYDFYKVDNNNFVNFLNISKYVKIIDLIQNSYKTSLKYLINLENQNLLIKQVWGYELNNTENLFKNDVMLDHIINNKIVEYAKFYKNIYFAQFSIEYFFNKFLTILEDIDTIYNPYKDYQNSLNYYLKDLQNFEDFSENFEVTFLRLKINFLTYSLLKKLYKNVLEEKIVVIQKNFKQKLIYEFFTSLRPSVLKIQNIWKKKFYGKLSKKNIDKCFYLLIDKYKSKKPVMFNTLRNLYKNQIKLSVENKKLKEDLSNFKKENKLLQINANELNKQINLNNSNVSGGIINLNTQTKNSNKMKNINSNYNTDTKQIKITANIAKFNFTESSRGSNFDSAFDVIIYLIIII